MTSSSDKFLQALLDKLDHVSGNQAEMKVHIAEIRKDLAHHIRRTDLAEESIKLLRQEAAADTAAQANDIKPVKKHVAMMEGALKLLGIVAVVVGIVASVIKILKP
jgi:hypothetical protein